MGIELQTEVGTPNSGPGNSTMQGPEPHPQHVEQDAAAGETKLPARGSEMRQPGEAMQLDRVATPV